MTYPTVFRIDICPLIIAIRDLGSYSKIISKKSETRTQFLLFGRRIITYGAGSKKLDPTLSISGQDFPLSKP